MTIHTASVGLGWWGRELANAVGSISDLDIVACTSPNEEERDGFAREFGCRAAETFEDILHDPTIDAVLLATPHSLHADQVIDAARSGKHVFVEKPFTLTVDSGVRAATACRDAGVVLAVGHNRRLSGGAQTLRDLRDKGELGDVLHLEAHFSSPSALTYSAGQWRADRAEAPGGGLASMGLHMIDTMQWLFGPIRRTSCLARRQAAPVNIDDVTTAMFVFESGVTATLSSLFTTTLDAWLRVCTTAGIFTASDDFARVVHRPLTGEAIEMPVTPVDTVKIELQAFADAINGTASVAVSAENALTNIAVMEAMMTSAAKAGAWTEVQVILPDGA